LPVTSTMGVFQATAVSKRLLLGGLKGWMGTVSVLRRPERAVLLIEQKRPAVHARQRRLRPVLPRSPPMPPGHVYSQSMITTCRLNNGMGAVLSEEAFTARPRGKKSAPVAPITQVFAPRAIHLGAGLDTPAWGPRTHIRAPFMLCDVIVGIALQPHVHPSSAGHRNSAHREPTLRSGIEAATKTGVAMGARADFHTAKRSATLRSGCLTIARLRLTWPMDSMAQELRVAEQLISRIGPLPMGFMPAAIQPAAVAAWGMGSSRQGEIGEPVLVQLNRPGHEASSVARIRFQAGRHQQGWQTGEASSRHTGKKLTTAPAGGVSGLRRASFLARPPPTGQLLMWQIRANDATFGVIEHEPKHTPTGSPSSAASAWFSRSRLRPPSRCVAATRISRHDREGLRWHFESPAPRLPACLIELSAGRRCRQYVARKSGDQTSALAWPTAAMGAEYDLGTSFTDTLAAGDWWRSWISWARSSMGIRCRGAGVGNQGHQLAVAPAQRCRRHLRAGKLAALPGCPLGHLISSCRHCRR